MCVNRCVCFDVTFERLKRHIDTHGGGFDEIQRAFQCGKGCGLCIPYIRRMIHTGETSMPIMQTDDTERTPSEGDGDGEGDDDGSQVS